MKTERTQTRSEKGLTHVRIQRVVQIFREVSRRTATPVLKDVQIGLSLILQEDKRERAAVMLGTLVSVLQSVSSGTINHLASVLSKLKPTNTDFLRYHLTIQ